MGENDEYCYGGTSMYMDGFQWRGVYCVIYQFPAWTLNARWKVFLACVGTILSGIFLEGIITARRQILLSKEFRKKSRNMKLYISMSIYGIQVTVGYLVMLIVMTYNIPLFICVILGLMIGHVLFQVIDIMKVSSKVLPKNKKLEAYSVNNSVSHKSSSIIIEGATPCCQNHVVSLDNNDDDNENNSNDHYGTFDKNDAKGKDHDETEVAQEAPESCCHEEKTMKKHEVVQEPPASCCHGHVVDDDEVEYKDTDKKIDGDYDIESSSLPISNPEVSCCGGDGSAGMKSGILHQ